MMGEDCTICHGRASRPLYTATSERALTSLCQIREGRVEIWACEDCGHLFGKALADVGNFYEQDYKILLNQEDEDQIYDRLDGVITYRTDHQMAVMGKKLALPQNPRVLDYGCAKASMAKRLSTRRPDADLHLFDVSHLYLSFWQNFIARDKIAIHQTPPSWNGSFDLVMSFFAFEHIPTPGPSTAHIHGLLKEGGVFYGVVPYVFSNIADFIVIDHVNHFTRSSMHHLLSDHGFGDISIDSDSHRGALVFSAIKGGSPTPVQVEDIRTQAKTIAQYWTSIDDRIQTMERTARQPAAIYGAGFYGAYIFNTLENPHNIACFIDQNPWLVGRTMFRKPIIAPADLPADIATLYVGLNPAHGRAILQGQDWLTECELDLVFLESDLDD